MIEWIVTSCALIVVIIALRKLLKGRISLRLQYALWALVLIRLLVPLSFGSSRMSVMNGVNKALPEREFSENIGIFTAAKPAAAPKSLKTSEPQEAKTGASSAGNLSTDGGSLYTITQDDGTILIQPAGAPVVSIEEPMRPLLTASPERNAVRASGSTAVSAPSEQTKESSENGGRNLSLKAVLDAVWLSGAIITGAVFLFSNISFFLRLKKSRRRLENADSKLPVYVSGAVETPCLFGLFRPSIYLTDRSANDEAQLHHILLHEQTHYRHGDHVFSMLRALCLALHWYNPLVWLAAILSRRDQELACDESVIKRIGESRRADYARTLIELTCEKRSLPFLSATTMTGSASSIKERITLIVKKPKTSAAVLVAALAAVAILIGCTFTGAKRIESAAPKTDEASNEAPKNSIAAANANDEWFLNDAARLAKQIEKSYPFELDADKASVERYNDESLQISVYIPFKNGRFEAYINYLPSEQWFCHEATLDNVSINPTTSPFGWCGVHDEVGDVPGINHPGIIDFDVDEQLAVLNGDEEALGMKYANEYAKLYTSVSTSSPMHCTEVGIPSCTVTARSVLKTMNCFKYCADIAVKPDDFSDFIYNWWQSSVCLCDSEKHPGFDGFLILKDNTFILADETSTPYVEGDIRRYWGMISTDDAGSYSKNEVLSWLANLPSAYYEFGTPGLTETIIYSLANIDLEKLEKTEGERFVRTIFNQVMQGSVGEYRECVGSPMSDSHEIDQQYRNVYVIRAILGMNDKHASMFSEVLKVQRDYNPELFFNSLLENFNQEEETRIIDLIGGRNEPSKWEKNYDYFLFRIFFSLLQPSGERYGEFFFDHFDPEAPLSWTDDDSRIVWNQFGHITEIELSGDAERIPEFECSLNIASLNVLKKLSVSNAKFDQLNVYGCPALTNVDFNASVEKTAFLSFTKATESFNINLRGDITLEFGKRLANEYYPPHYQLHIFTNDYGYLTLHVNHVSNLRFNLDIEAHADNGYKFFALSSDTLPPWGEETQSLRINANNEGYVHCYAHFARISDYADLDFNTALDMSYLAAKEFGEMYGIDFLKSTAVFHIYVDPEYVRFDFSNDTGDCSVSVRLTPDTSSTNKPDIGDCFFDPFTRPARSYEHILPRLDFEFPILKRETELAPTSEELEKAVLAYGDKLIELFTSAGDSYEAICDDAKLLACERYERLDNDGEYGCYVDLLLHPVDLARFLNNITRAEIYAESDHPEYRGYFRLRGYALLDDDGSDFVSAAKFENNPRALAYYIEGDASNVQIEEMSSERYSDDELDMAVQTIIENFRYEDDCTLEKLAYTGDAQSELEAQKYSDSADSADMLLFVSTVKVGDFGPDDSLEPNATYDNWYWLLSRNKGGAFTVLDSGPWN